MKQYKKIQGADFIRNLRLETDDKGNNEYGSSRFKGETLDIVLPDNKHIKRVTFGIHEIWKTHHVAVISEILKVDTEPKGDFIDHVLNQACYENGWD